MDIKVSTEENIPKVEAKLPPIEIGRDGYTPYIQEGILEDGTIADTWWVNGEDTHKPSRGIKGEDGDTVDTSNFMKSDGSNYKEGMSLVTPVLLGTMIIVNKGVDSDSTAIADKTVEKGTVIKLTAHYKWEAKEGYTNPTGIYKNDADASSIYITSPIPECG